LMFSSRLIELLARSLACSCWAAKQVDAKTRGAAVQFHEHR
jgi:hypothetical protein